MYRLGCQNLIEGVEADVGYQSDTPDQQRTDIAELRPRLNHLGKSELRSLGRMERHEERAERAPEDDRHRHPYQIATERDAHYARGDGCQMRVAGKPYRPQVPNLAVALSERNIVDGTLLDQ